MAENIRIAVDIGGTFTDAVLDNGSARQIEPRHPEAPTHFLLERFQLAVRPVFRLFFVTRVKSNILCRYR